MSADRPPSRGRSQPSVRWANTRSPSHSPSRFHPDAMRADPAYVQVSPREPSQSYRTMSPSRSRSRHRSVSSHRSRSFSRSRSRGPSIDRDHDYVEDRPRSRSSKSWTDKAPKAPKLRDENGKIVKSSIAIIGALGAAAYVAHRALPKVLPGSHDDKSDHHRSTSHDKHDRHDRHDRRDDRHRHGEHVERHRRYASFYEEDGPPRPREEYYSGRDERRAQPPRSDVAEPAWSRQSQSTATPTRYIEPARPSSRGAIPPGLYTGEDDKVLYIDGEGRRYKEEYRSDRFWPGGRLP